jgi:plasmid stabilization system protein ParE
LQSAFDWYEERRAGLGLEFIKEFRGYYYRLKQTPLRYSIRFADIRRVNLDRFPYAIFYIAAPEELRVLAVIHGGRDLQAILAQRRQAFLP